MSTWIKIHANTGYFASNTVEDLKYISNQLVIKSPDNHMERLWHCVLEVMEILTVSLESPWNLSSQYTSPLQLTISYTTNTKTARQNARISNFSPNMYGGKNKSKKVMSNINFQNIKQINESPQQYGIHNL